MSIMRPDQKYILQRQRFASAHGFALVSAIFLLVVLAALGAFMVSFSTVQHATSAQDMNGSRAYQAARSGMEWGAYQVMRTPTFVCGGTTTLLPLPGTLAPFSVSMQCTKIQASEGAVANNVNLFRIVSTASLGTIGSANYVERQLQGLVER